mgnify:CR=1 FL=1
MLRRSGLMFLGTGLLTGSVAIASTMAGCQSNTTSSSTTTSGSGGSSTTSGTGGNSTGTGGNTSGTGGNSTGTGGDTTGTGGTMVEETTIKDITTNKVGPGLKVKLSGVVAMLCRKLPLASPAETA